MWAVYAVCCDTVSRKNNKYGLMKRFILNERGKIFNTVQAEKEGIMHPPAHVQIFNDEIRVEKGWKCKRAQM
jgi:hypothetical protein